MRCGTSLAALQPMGERKVITALFCDLVGSTELADRLDPEDVDRLLRAYHGIARRRIQAFGGTVEKFIGDAVVGRVRHPVRARGRPGASHPGGAAADRGGPRIRPRPPRADRDLHGRDARPDRPRPRLRRGLRDRRHPEHRRPPAIGRADRRRRRCRAHAAGDRAHLPVGRPRRPRPQGPRGTDARVAAARADRPCDRRADRRDDPVRRPRAGARDPHQAVRAFPDDAIGRGRHDHRRPRDRQEPARPRAQPARRRPARTS